MGNDKARQLYEEAIALDPEFAMAYAELACTHLIDAFLGWSKDPRESGTQGLRNGEQGTQLWMTHWIPRTIFLA